MRNKINLSGFTIGAAALFVGLAGNTQAIPITDRDFRVSEAARAPHLGRQSPSPSLASLTASILPKPVKKGTKPQNVRGHQRPGAGNLILPVSGGLPPISGQGAFPVNDLHAPLLPASPVNLPPPSVVVVSGSGGATQNAASVPDGGATAALMAGSFGGLALLRKKLKA